MVRKRLRVRLDLLFKGSDVEVPAAIESHHTLTYQGAKLDEELTLAYYDINKDARLVATSWLVGEGKRARAGGASSEDPNNTSGAAIMDMTDFTMEMKLGVEKIKFNYVEWVAGLTIVQHLELKEVMLEHQRHIMSDSTIRKYATFVAIFGELEV
jgi:hypothetical protein